MCTVTPRSVTDVGQTYSAPPARHWPWPNLFIVSLSSVHQQPCPPWPLSSPLWPICPRGRTPLQPCTLTSSTPSTLYLSLPTLSKCMPPLLSMPCKTIILSCGLTPLTYSPALSTIICGFGGVLVRAWRRQLWFMKIYQGVVHPEKGSMQMVMDLFRGPWVIRSPSTARYRSLAVVPGHVCPWSVNPVADAGSPRMSCQAD